MTRANTVTSRSFRRFACAACVLLVATTATAGPIELVIADAEGGPGESVTVPVTVKGIKGAISFQMAVEYDPDVLEPEGAEVGEMVEGGMAETDAETEEGKLGVTVAISPPLEEDEGQFLTLTFKVVGEKGDASELTPVDVEAHTDDDGLPQILVASADGGEFKVTGGGMGLWVWIIVAAVAVLVIVLILVIVKLAGRKPPTGGQPVGQPYGPPQQPQQ